MEIVPQSFDGASRWLGSGHLLHIYLAPTLVAQVAEDVGRTDLAHVQIARHLDLYDPLLQHIGQELVTELRVSGFGGRLYAESLGTAAALHLIRTYSPFTRARTLPTHKLAPASLHRVLDYINDHLEQDLSLAALAAVAHLSPSHFLRQFKATTGLAPHQYLVHQRVERAMWLLREGQHTIAVVAQVVGFADQSHLGRHFKRAFGVSPRAVLVERKNVPD